MSVSDPGGRRFWPAISPVTADRILIGSCAAVWLLLVGAGVAATVALVDLGRGFHRASNPHTPTVLYAVIVVSALVILAAVPVLLYARRRTGSGPGGVFAASSALAGGAQRSRHGYAPAATVPVEVRTERLSAISPALALPQAAVDRIWLRGTVGLVGAMGVALVAVAVATYLMAIGREGASWSSYVVAGVVTAVMPAIPWRHLRQLRRMLESPWTSG